MAARCRHYPALGCVQLDALSALAICGAGSWVGNAESDARPLTAPVDVDARHVAGASVGPPAASERVLAQLV